MRILGTLAAGLLLAAGSVVHAQAQDDRQVLLQADAYRTPSGPVARFAETSSERTMNSPVIGRLEVTRPGSVSVRRPAAGRALGRLELFVGPRTCATCADRRVLRLRRVRSLGDGAFLLAEGFGARIVLSTRSRRFLTVSLPDGARNVELLLKGAGARLLRFDCSRSAFSFEGRFAEPTDVDRDAASLSRRRLVRAGLC